MYCLCTEILSMYIHIQIYIYSIQAAKKQLEGFGRMIEKMNAMTNMKTEGDTGFIYTFPDDPSIKWDKPLVENKTLFPCLLTMLGSGFGSMLVRTVYTMQCVQFQ